MAKQYATAVGKRVLTMWANQQCTLQVLNNALADKRITQAEYDAAIEANPPVNPDDPGSYSQPSGGTQ